MSSSAQKGLCDYEVRLCDCIAMPAGMWHADLRELADQEGPVLKRRRQSRGSLQAEASVCTCQADGYGAGNRELQCSLAHASMLEAGTCTARLPACSSDHTGGAHVPQSLKACHEKCLRPSWRVFCLRAQLSYAQPARPALHGPRHGLQPQSAVPLPGERRAVGGSCASAQPTVQRNLCRKISSTQTTAGPHSGRARALRVPSSMDRADKRLPRLVLPTLPGGLQFTPSPSCTLRMDLRALPSAALAHSMPPVASIGPKSQGLRVWAEDGPRHLEQGQTTLVLPGAQSEDSFHDTFPQTRSGLSCQAPTSIRAASTIALRSLGPTPLTNAMGRIPKPSA